MRTKEEWQAIARAVTDPLPPLTEQQNRELTKIAVAYARRKQSEQQAA